MSSLLSNRPSRTYGAIALIAAALATTSPAAAALSSVGGSGPGAAASPKPTVVLVHGAFGDASGWRGVIERLQRLGYPVVAPANPLRGLAGDSVYLASFLKSVKGPVILVGHSYGGAVISNAAAADPDVKALVFIAAFAPEKGESAADLTVRFPGSLVNSSIYPVSFPLPGGRRGTDLYAKPDKFRELVVADVPARTAAVMAASQRPISFAALAEKSRVAAWKTLPSWYLVASDDRAIPPAAERFMAERAGSHTVEIRSSHFAMVSHPEAVTRLIRDAAAGRTAPSAAGRTAPSATALAETGSTHYLSAAAGIGALTLATGTALVLAVRRRRPGR